MRNKFKMGNELRKGKEPWNKGLTKENNKILKESSNKQSCTKKRLFSEGKLIIHNKGKSLEEEYGNKRAEEINKKNKRFFGKHHSEEERLKIGLASKGRIFSEKSRINIIKSLKGIPKSEEHKNKISDSRIKLFKEHPEKHPNFIMAKRHHGQSKQQFELYLLIKEKYPEAILEYPIKTNYSTRFADIAIPSLKLDIEFDGSYWHQNKQLDDLRDNHLSEIGWKTIRIDKDNIKIKLEEVFRK